MSQEFLGQNDIQKLVLGAIFRISSAPHLRDYVMKSEFLSILRLLIMIN
jgi:hypothetical protein